MFDFYEASIQFGKLIVAALLGGAIGFEREAHGQAAGIRTNILVGVGACLMMMLSLHMEEIFRHLDIDSVVRLDPGRIASYAIASMGFLGAGAIIKGKGSVRGLTTAAGLWLVTGIGLAVGAGYLFPAIASTLLSLLILYGIRRLKIFFSRDIYTILVLKFDGLGRPLEHIKKIFTEHTELTIQFINFHQSFSPPQVTYRLRLQSKEIIPWKELVGKLSALHGIKEITWEEGKVP
ncbi:MAG: MgtC/SapB family protein [Nitrospirae bacterium]|jgi:putative Mg2+ transporter-C (MgtC) family protein|nr:MgtC/SapB family protein [Nitrospirota bacterium]